VSDDELGATQQAPGEDVAILVNDSFEWEEGNSHVQ
jgi:hypothetical protein